MLVEPCSCLEHPIQVERRLPKKGLKYVGDSFLSSSLSREPRHDVSLPFDPPKFQTPAYAIAIFGMNQLDSASKKAILNSSSGFKDWCRENKLTWPGGLRDFLRWYRSLDRTIWMRVVSFSEFVWDGHHRKWCVSGMLHATSDTFYHASHRTQSKATDLDLLFGRVGLGTLKLDLVSRFFTV